MRGLLFVVGLSDVAAHPPMLLEEFDLLGRFGHGGHSVAGLGEEDFVAVYVSALGVDVTLDCLRR